MSDGKMSVSGSNRVTNIVSIEKRNIQMRSPEVILQARTALTPAAALAVAAAVARYGRLQD